MNSEIGQVRAEVLKSGTDDWVSVPEVLYAARQALGGVSEAEALPLVIESIKSLLQSGLIEVGEATEVFTPWRGSLESIIERVSLAFMSVRFPILPSEPFWINLTAAGQECGSQLLADELNSD